MTTYEIQVELETGYTMQAIEAASSADEARENLFRKLNGMGWRAGKHFTLGSPALVEVTSAEHRISVSGDYPEHDTMFADPSEYTDGDDYRG